VTKKLKPRTEWAPTPEQTQALLGVSEVIAQHRDLIEMVRDLATRLYPVAPFDFVSLVLHEPERDLMRLHVLCTRIPLKTPAPAERPALDSPAGWAWRSQEPLVIPDFHKESRYESLLTYLRHEGFSSACWLPLTTAQRRLGAMGFGSNAPRPYRRAELQFLQRVARQVALAVDNALQFQKVESYQLQLARERDRLRLLLEVNNALIARRNLHDLFAAISSSLRQLFHCEYASLALFDPATQQMRLRALDFPTGKGFLEQELGLPLESSPAGMAFATRKPLVLGRAELDKVAPELARRVAAEGLCSGVCIPLIAGSNALGTLNLASRREGAFSQQDVDFLSQVAGQIAIAVENALAYREIVEIKDKLAEEKLYLEDEIRTEYNSEEMIGDSPAWQRILEQVKTVAPTNSTVLILGETGTGKELVARAIHNWSTRRAATFVKMNCAAIPAGLLESELFGHEKGAFTGAIDRRVGRFELANRGTLFLDEIGDVPLELQPKLLRVLQEQEFERLGGVSTVRVDVRLVAATNRDLSRMVAERLFRSDLFYRLNIFPIVVPPLRERPEDIPHLVRYFAQKYSRQMNRRIESVPASAMQAMVRYPWPGNIRELENFIERAVILTQGSELRIPVAELRAHADAAPSGISTLEAAERQHILRALERSRGIIGGPGGAAVRLGIKRTTLQSRMRRLGIPNRLVRSAPKS
jgi:formate hydrogenlyase transcriptional activator